MAADIYTKAFNGAPEWQAGMKLVNHLDPGLFWAGRRVEAKCICPVNIRAGSTSHILPRTLGQHSQMIEGSLPLVPPVSKAMCGTKPIITDGSSGSPASGQTHPRGLSVFPARAIGPAGMDHSSYTVKAKCLSEYVCVLPAVCTYQGSKGIVADLSTAPSVDCCSLIPCPELMPARPP